MTLSQEKIEKYIKKGNYYKVGHSAIVLINPNQLKCHYFDFGRYHAPKNYGRVRDEITDHVRGAQV